MCTKKCWCIQKDTICWRTTLTIKTARWHCNLYDILSLIRLWCCVYNNIGNEQHDTEVHNVLCYSLCTHWTMSYTCYDYFQPLVIVTRKAGHFETYFLVCVMLEIWQMWKPHAEHAKLTLNVVKIAVQSGVPYYHHCSSALVYFCVHHVL